MATGIKFEPRVNAVKFGSLGVSEKFMLHTPPEKSKDTVYMKIPNLFEKSRDMYLKNAINISTGNPVEFTESALVIPVDLDITVYK